MADRPQKKQPTDYPQMAFRIKSEDKDGIMNFIEQIQEIANQQVGKNDKRLKKNEIIVDALWLGLLQIKKKYRLKKQDHGPESKDSQIQDQPLDSEAS